MPCKFCDDGDGVCAYPYYGVAPHEHDGADGAILGLTRLLPKEQWGENFRQDPQVPWCGTYLRCDSCGDGEPTMTTQCKDGGSMCTDCEAQGRCYSEQYAGEIHTSPGALEEERENERGGMKMLAYAIGLTSLGAAIGLALAGYGR